MDCLLNNKTPDNAVLSEHTYTCSKVVYIFVLLYKREAFEKCWAHSPLRAAERPNFTLPFTRCRYCHKPPAHRCPRQRRRRQRQQQRQR